MDRLLLDVLLWVVITGFVTFCILYAALVKPWQDHMGRHILAFMVGFAIAFIYAMISRYIEEPWRTRGWNLMLLIISGLVWWRVIMLVEYQVKARR